MSGIKSSVIGYPPVWDLDHTHIVCVTLACSLHPSSELQSSTQILPTSEISDVSRGSNLRVGPGVATFGLAIRLDIIDVRYRKLLSYGVHLNGSGEVDSIGLAMNPRPVGVRATISPPSLVPWVDWGRSHGDHRPGLEPLCWRLCDDFAARVVTESDMIVVGCGATRSPPDGMSCLELTLAVFSVCDDFAARRLSQRECGRLLSSQCADYPQMIDSKPSRVVSYDRLFPWVAVPTGNHGVGSHPTLFWGFQVVRVRRGGARRGRSSVDSAPPQRPRLCPRTKESPVRSAVCCRRRGPVQIGGCGKIGGVGDRTHWELYLYSSHPTLLQGLTRAYRQLIVERFCLFGVRSACPNPTKLVAGRGA
uniref:Uncharacterized protein n=1 Tax=Ananas comosus var. bracteatus TaxID=296719 RepID=A0A6V7PGN2_ANACO|nr:unnamed protein product [Ananas comosus var. bracteatus]